MKTSKTKFLQLFRGFSLTLIIVFVCLTAGIIIAGISYYSFLANHTKTEINNELSSIADLKVIAITQWRRERLNDGVMIQNEAISRQLQEYLTQGIHKNEIINWLDAFTLHNGYSGALFLDGKGNVKLSIGTHGDTLGVNESALAREAAQQKEIIFSDLRMSAAFHTPTLNLLVPILRSNKTLVGTLILRIDPNKVFYPLIHSLPLLSHTTEIVLVRRDGDSILSLNELRYKKDSALKFRLPLTMTELPGSKAIGGFEGTVEGTDYRGVAVLSAIRKVPHTPWFLIAKIDRDEVYTTLHDEAWLIGIFIIGMIITAGSVVGFWWRHQHALFYRKQYEDEVERKALVSHFDNVVKYANDIIILSEIGGRIIEVNDQACRKYGYNREEILQMNIRDLRPAHLRSEIELRLGEMNTEKGIVFETQHLRKDGTIFPVEISARHIIVEERKYIHGIIRDISERKQIEESLGKLRKAVDASDEAIFMTDRNGMITFVNHGFTRMYGYEPQEVIGKTTPRILKGGEKTPEQYQAFWQEILTKKPVVWEITNRTKDGRFLTVQDSVSSVLDDEGNIVGFLSIQRDISDRKEYEGKIRNLSRVYQVLSDVNQAIVRTRNQDELFNKICRIAVSDGGFVLVWIGLYNEATQQIEVVANAGYSNGYLEQLLITVDDSPRGEGPTATAFREGKHFVCNDIEHDERMVPWRDNALQRGYRSVASFPIIVFGKPMGTINFYSSDVGYFNEKEIALLDELTADVMFALESMRLEEDRRKSERETIEAHKFTKTILDNSPVGIVTYRATGECVSANETIAQMVGATVEQLQAQNFRTLASWKESGLLDAAERALATGKAQQIDFHLVSTFGKEGWYAGRLSPFISNKEKHLLVIFTDISERKRIEEQLRSSEQYYRQLINTSPDGIAIVDKEAMLTFASPRMYEIFNLTPEENVVGQSILQWIAPEDRPNVVKNLKALTQTKTSVGATEYRLLRRDSTVFWGEFMASAVLDAKGNLTGIMVVCHDITERKLAEELIRASELKYRDIFTWSPVGIFQATLDGKIRTANESLAHILRRDHADELLGLSMQKDVYLDSREGEKHFEEQHNESKASTSEYQWKTKDGASVWVSVTCRTVSDGKGNALYHEGFVYDITKRKILEEEIRQTQKLESLGTLASGIAHDFNNILGIILGHASLLERLSKNAPGMLSSVESITKATQRGAALVRQLLTFARKSETFIESVRINDIVQELAKLIAETFPKSIKVVTKLAPGLPSVRGDATQLHQVVLNLSVNARDAMPDGGSLTFSTSLASKETVREKFPHAGETKYICITVSDTGVGMDENTRRRIFEPFFTTKGLGKGTGLGMSVVYGIVDSYRGFISVESEPGKGATFTIFLPVELETEEERTAPTGEEETRGGTETVLIIEDEEMLRIIFQEMLEEKGYRVLTAADGEEALEVFSKHQRSIAVVVSDVGLPKMTGDKVFYSLKEKFPAVKVILASGFLEPDLKAKLSKAGVLDFVQKPYRRQEILTKIRSAIDKKMM